MLRVHTLLLTMAILYGFRNNVDAGNYNINAELTADIVINKNLLDADGSINTYPTYEWTPIGSKYGFQGTFDGKGHTISGLFVDAVYNDIMLNVGLFASLSGTIKNLNIMNSLSLIHI